MDLAKNPDASAEERLLGVPSFDRPNGAIPAQANYNNGMNQETQMPKRRRLWVWILLLVVLIPCFWLVYRAEQQRAVVQWINSNADGNDGGVWYAYQVSLEETPWYKNLPPRPAGLTALGVDYFSPVVLVNRPMILNDNALFRLATLTRIRNLHLDRRESN